MTRIGARLWLVKRRQRRQLFQLVEDRIVDQHGRRELLAAMHDSMADRHDAQVIRVSGDPLVKHRKHAHGRRHRHADRERWSTTRRPSASATTNRGSDPMPSIAPR